LILSHEKLKEAGTAAGIDMVGAVAVSRLDHEGEHLDSWLASGHQGDMLWIERDPEKRKDPRSIFPATRTVISAAVNYNAPFGHADIPETGKISRYAWGDDYHDIVKDRLRRLLELIQIEVPDAEGKVCVDTAPVMEKSWAVRAGLGWIGKHSNLITRELGSWVFLGEILINVDVGSAASIVPDHCGSCTACIEACPTGAITEPYVVDSTKCISYATIELRADELPPAIAENLNGWVYGCDICQDVCPWNRFEQPTSDERFFPREGETQIRLETLTEMEHPEYVERFRGSAMKRAKLQGLKRNARALKDS
jgi:epoxyqueuosine reductase